MIRAMVRDVHDIAAADWQPKLNAHGEIVEGLDDIRQCIRIILGTPKGSDPHRPTFGSDLWRYIDFPIDDAIPNVIRESVDAIRIWETRIDVVRVVPRIEPAHIHFDVEFRLKGRDEVLASEVRYERG